MRDYREKTERETRRFDLITLFMVNKKVTSYSYLLKIITLTITITKLKRYIFCSNLF